MGIGPQGVRGLLRDHAQEFCARNSPTKDILRKAGINNSSGRSWVTQQRFPDHIITGTYDYGFSLDLLKKDVDTAKSICQEHSHMQNPTTFLIHKQSDLLAKAQDKLEDGADHVEIYKMFE